jgi:hypothetical protein
VGVYGFGFWADFMCSMFGYTVTVFFLYFGQ